MILPNNPTRSTKKTFSTQARLPRTRTRRASPTRPRPQRSLNLNPSHFPKHKTRLPRREVGLRLCLHVHRVVHPSRIATAPGARARVARRPRRLRPTHLPTRKEEKVMVLFSQSFHSVWQAQVANHPRTCPTWQRITAVLIADHSSYRQRPNCVHSVVLMDSTVYQARTCYFLVLTRSHRGITTESRAPAHHLAARLRLHLRLQR
jgi:hypothetical protein